MSDHFLEEWIRRAQPQPEDGPTVAAVKAIFRDARYDVRSLMRAMFLEDAFWAKENRGVLVKSPVELVIGTLRMFHVQPIDLMRTRSGGWLVFDVHLEASSNPAGPCQPSGNRP